MLNQSVRPECDLANLERLRIQLSLAAHIADLGVLAPDGRLACVTTLGAFETPLPLPPADFLVELDGFQHHTRYNFPAFGTRGTVRTVAVAVGRFFVVLKPSATAGVANGGADAVTWVFDAQRTRVLHHEASLDAEARASMLADAIGRQAQRRFDGSQMAWIVTTPVEGTRYVVQSYLPLKRVLAEKASRLILIVTMVSLMALLLQSAMAILLRRWSDLSYRIERLVKPEHVACLYQPIVDLQSLKVVGCEVLMRLRDGERILYPDQTIPAIVSSGLTWQLDRLVIQSSIRELIEQLDGVKDFKVAFNVFPENVKHVELQEVFESALQQRPHGFLFDIEIIEQHYRDSVIDEVAQLRAHDFLVSVDDFGTGYSNLGVLRKLAPDFLKIDRSFVMEMEDASIRSSLIPEITAIARVLGAAVIAEGIENVAQLGKLRGMGVEYGQGYLFAKPIPIQDLVALIRSPTPRAWIPPTAS